MEQSYHLSAGALLYAVRLLRKRGIYGVPNVMPKLSEPSFPTFAQDAEMELQESGCGVMNFDGDFALEPSFAELLGRCADCTEVIGASLRSVDKTWRKMTAYLAAGALLERPEEYQCTLRAVENPGKEMIKALKLQEVVRGEAVHASEIETPASVSLESQRAVKVSDASHLSDADAHAESSAGLSEVRVDTDDLEKRNLSALLDAGCSHKMAKMVFAALDGTGHYAHLTHTINRERVGERLLLYGEAGILDAIPEYTEKQELLRLTPVTEEAVLSGLQEWTEDTEGLENPEVLGILPPENPEASENPTKQENSEPVVYG